MDHDNSYDLEAWVTDDCPQFQRDDKNSRQFSIGVWQGEKCELQENKWKTMQSSNKDENIFVKRQNANTNILLSGREHFLRQRTHSDNDPLSDVTNRASINFTVNRLSLDNVESVMSNAIEEIVKTGSPCNSNDGVKYENQYQIRDALALRGQSPLAEILCSNKNEYGRYSPEVSRMTDDRGVACMTEPPAGRQHRYHLHDNIETRYNIWDQPKAILHCSKPLCQNCNNSNLGRLRLDDSEENLLNPQLLSGTSDYGNYDRPRRAILKSQSTNTLPKLESNQHDENSQTLFDSGVKYPLGSLMKSRSRTPILGEKYNHTPIPDVPRKPVIRSETGTYRSLKKKFPPEYFTQSDKCVFEFFKDYKINVFLTFSQRNAAESALGMRNPLTDDNPFKHLPAQCLKGVLNGSISALDFGLYWQWLSDAVSKSSLRTMMLTLLSKYPNLLDSWKLPFSEDSIRYARLIDHICHVLMMASEVGEFARESRHGRFIAACKRAIEADRNPAPLNHDFVSVALSPLLGHDPILLEKVLCAIPRYKMSFSQMFGSYGTGTGEFTEPSGLAVLKDGRLAVVDTNQHRVMIFRDDKHLDLCFSSDEEAMHTDKLARLDLEKQQMRNVASRNRRWNGYLMYPNRAAVDPNTGHLVLTERAPHPQVQVFTEDGRFVKRFGEGYLENPRGLCVDHLSRVIVVECKIMRVTIWAGTQLQKDFIVNDLGFPNSIAADTHCRLYITDNEAHCVRIFSYGGQSLGSVGGPGLTNFPVAVRLRPADGAICVFDNHNNFNMTVFTSEGALLEARESEIKHAQIHDVQLRPSDGAVIQAGKDYRVYVYKPYPFFLRGRDQRSPHLMSALS